MADPLTFHDLEFHFTSGELVSVTVQEGRDTIENVRPCTHCGAAAQIQIWVALEHGASRSLLVYIDKLNGMDRTTRLEQPPTEPEL